MVPLTRRLATEGVGTFWLAAIVGALAAGFSYAWRAYDVGEPVVGEAGPVA